MLVLFALRFGAGAVVPPPEVPSGAMGTSSPIVDLFGMALEQMR